MKGHLIANVVDDGKPDVGYHHVTTNGKIMVGEYLSIPEKLGYGRMKFREEWEWLSGDKSSGYSEIVKVDSL